MPSPSAKSLILCSLSASPPVSFPASPALSPVLLLPSAAFSPTSLFPVGFPDAPEVLPQATVMAVTRTARMKYTVFLIALCLVLFPAIFLILFFVLFIVSPVSMLPTIPLFKSVIKPEFALLPVAPCHYLSTISPDLALIDPACFMSIVCPVSVVYPMPAVCPVSAVYPTPAVTPAYATSSSIPKKPVAGPVPLITHPIRAG